MHDPVDLSEAFLTACLKEYDALASANADTIKRIETVRGLYITTVLGVVALLSWHHKTFLRSWSGSKAARIY